MTFSLKKVLFYFAISVSVIIFFVSLSGIYFDIPRSELERKYAKPPSQFLELLDKTRIHYRDEGSSALPALVLLHGANGSLFNFDRLSPLIKDDFRIITIDLPAFGLTGAVPSSDYSITSSFRVIDSVLGHLNIEHFILGGNSMGGGVSWRYAIENPKKVKGLVLLSSSGVPSESSKIQTDGESRETPLVWKLMRSPLAVNILSIYTPKFFATQGLKASVHDSSIATTEWANQFHELTLLEGSRRAILSRISTGYERNQNPDLLRDLEIPALIIHGKEDNIIPVSSSEKLVTFFQNGKLIIYDEVGHLPMYEAPERTAQDIRNFFLTQLRLSF